MNYIESGGLFHTLEGGQKHWSVCLVTRREREFKPSRLLCWNLDPVVIRSQLVSAFELC